MLPSVTEKAEVSFAEIPYTPAVGREDIPGVSEVGRTPAAVIRTSAMSIEISNQISESLLSRILRRYPMLEDAAGIRRVWSLPAEQLTSGRELMAGNDHRGSVWTESF